MTKFTQIIAGTAVGIALAGGAAVGLGYASDGFTNWDVTTWGKRIVEQSDKLDTDDFSVTPAERSKELSLSARSVATPYAVDPSYTITATVTGAVTTPKIDWTIEKSDDFASTVENPVTVTPTSDGALTATVTCTKAFTGTVTVRATIRGVGSSTTCTVVFEGIPTGLSVGSTTLTNSDGYLKANALGTYTVDLNLTNSFGQVGDRYGDYNISVSRAGEFNVALSKYSVVGTPPAVYPAWVNIGSSKLTFADAAVDDFVTFSLSGNRITINVNEALASYSTTSSDGVRLTYSSTVSTCYYTVTATDSVSGLSTSFKVTWGDALLSTVALSDETLTF